MISFLYKYFISESVETFGLIGFLYNELTWKKIIISRKKNPFHSLNDIVKNNFAY